MTKDTTKTAPRTTSVALIKALRAKTGAPMADCARALGAANDDIEEAVAWLRAKSIIRSQDVAHRPTSAGLMVSYVHQNRIGVLVEVQTETDFTAKNDEVQTFALDVAMHVAAANPRFLSVESIGEGLGDQPFVNRERSVIKSQMLDDEKMRGKPSEMVAKVADAKLKKRLEESSLLTQVWIRDSKRTIESLRAEVSHKTGENIRVKRFARWEVGV